MDKCVHELVADQAARHPDAVALRFGGERIGYRELDHAADRLARGLIERGLGRGDVIAVLLERGPGLVVAALAVLKAGAAYTLLDPEFPAARLETMLAESGARLLLTDPGLSGYCDTGRLGIAELPAAPGAAEAERTDAVPFPRVRPGDPACVMFTSGSTGRPKGVLAPHRAVSAAVTAAEYCDITASDVVLQAAQVSWDVFAQELWGALVHGATCVLQPGQRPDPARIAELVERHGVTVMYAAASLFNHLLDDHPAVFLRLEQVMTGGEPLSTEHVRRALALRPGLRLVNGYGPVETMILSTFHPVTARDLDRAAIPLGTAFPGDAVYVLDDRLRPVPAGGQGEIYLAGAGLAHGYVGRPAASAERFVADPFGGPGERMYRTGDLGRLAQDGVLEFLGRRDGQLKLRGMRIEPGEIEAVLVSHPEVAQAAVKAVDANLVAYVVPAAGAVGDPTRLREHCRAMLPDHMVPHLFVELPALPLNASGKLDRSALPRPATGRRPGSRAPGTGLERRLCELFAQVLEVGDVGIDDGFFELGGHSLTAARLAARIRVELGREADLRLLFAAPTVAGLARRLETGATATGAGPRLAARPRPETVPLTGAARRLWLLDLVEPGPAYNIPVLIRLSGPLDAGALRSALRDLVARHEILRTSFPAVDGEPVQVVAPAADVELPLVPAGAQALSGLVVQSAREPFDIRVAAPLRATLFRTAADDHALLLVIHHIACDGWSLRPLLRDLGAAYAARVAGRAPQWAPLTVQYADYTLWQQDRGAAREKELAAQLEFWRGALADLPDAEIGEPRPGPGTDPAQRASDVVSLRLDDTVCTRIRALAREHDCTPFMVLHTALNVLLARNGAETDLAVGTVTAGRDDPELDSSVGFFVNTIVLRTRSGGDPGFAELLRRSRETQLEAFGRQDVPFDALVSALQPTRGPGRTPFFQTMLILQNNLQAQLSMPGLVTEVSTPKTGVAKFDLLFEATGLEGPAGADALVIDLEYAVDRFDRVGAQGLLDALGALLEAGTRRPDAPISTLPLISAEQRRRILALTNPARPGEPEPEPADFTGLFAACVRRSPDADAVVCGPERWSYAQLDARSTALALRLRAHGIGAESAVASCLPRSIHAPAAFLAVLKAGGAYLPLDPEGPHTRAKFAVADADARVVLATPETAVYARGLGPLVLVIDDEDSDSDVETHPARLSPIRPRDLAYIIYTSGTTGTPKGVAIEHSTLTNLARAFQRTLGITEHDRVLQWASLTFDVSIGDLAIALTSGASLHIATAGERVGPELAARLRESAITAAAITPSAAASLPEDAALPELRTLMLAGEAVGPALAARWAPGRRLVNGYGPTETVYATAADLAADSPVVIGRPLPGLRVYVLDERLEPAPVAARGEIYIGGAGVGRGYVGRVGLTAERFVPDPFAAPGSRMYRTGDLGRIDADGRVEFLGRADDQVKIRGFRIELGEIEACLAAHPGIGRAAVLARRPPGQQDAPRLVCYLTPAAGTRPPADTELRTWLSARLPSYMVPALFIRLETLPSNAAGKIDRAALPPPPTGPVRAETGGDPAAAPRTPSERLVAQAWLDVLPVTGLTVHDDFFSLGGDSLSAVRLAARVEAATGRPLRAAQIFRTPTVAALAAHLDERGPDPDLDPPAFAAIPRRARRARPPGAAAGPQ